MEGVGADTRPASRVAAEIVAGGGAATADTSDVATPAGGRALVDTALERFGRLDVLINNAGIMRWAGLPELEAGDMDAHFAVHVGGSFNTTRAAWPHLAEQGYGRIVMTTSAGVFGLADNTAYATAKGGVVGLARSLAVAGAEHGIKVNCVAPAAFTRMAGRGAGSPQMTPDLVAPMVAVLAHETCPATGQIYAAGFGRFAHLFIASTVGYLHEGQAPTVEDVAEHWDDINDEAGYWIPTDLVAWSDAFTAHLHEDAGG